MIEYELVANLNKKITIFRYTPSQNGNSQIGCGMLPRKWTFWRLSCGWGVEHQRPNAGSWGKAQLFLQNANNLVIQNVEKFVNGKFARGICFSFHSWFLVWIPPPVFRFVDPRTLYAEGVGNIVSHVVRSINKTIAFHSHKHGGAGGFVWEPIRSLRVQHALVLKRRQAQLLRSKNRTEPSRFLRKELQI